MILSLAVILGLVVCFVRHRGHVLDQIAAIELKSAWLALLGLALQWPLLRAPAGPAQNLGVQQALFLLSHLLLLLFVWLNRRQVGVLLVGLGVVCNLVVILANGGFMPITPQTLVRINRKRGIHANHAPNSGPDQPWQCPRPMAGWRALWLFKGCYFGPSRDHVVVPVGYFGAPTTISQAGCV
jgi:hypothetical protein